MLSSIYLVWVVLDSPLGYEVHSAWAFRSNAVKLVEKLGLQGSPAYLTEVKIYD